MLRHILSQDQKPARVVVVGAGGFVGGAIAARLERDSVPVLRVTRRDADLLAADAGAKLTALLKKDDVLVAASAIAPCKNPAMLRDNMTLAVNLSQAAKFEGLAHVLNIGSDAVYSDSADPLTEASVTAPDNLHGIMHVARELIFRTEAKAPLATLRPTLIYGAGDPHNGYGPNRFRRLASKGEAIVLFGEGEERRDHVFIDDVAELATRIIYRRSTGALNAATGTVTSFRDAAALAVKLSGKDAPIKGSPRSGPMPHNGYRPFDPAATAAAFPDFRYTSLEAGLAESFKREAAGG